MARSFLIPLLVFANMGGGVLRFPVMSQMLKEAIESPGLVRAALEEDRQTYAGLGIRLRKLGPPGIATIARGSSDHAANYASYLFPLCTGRLVASLSPSLVTVLQAPLNLRDQFVLAVSQSGRSPDLLSAIEVVKLSGALTAGIVNDSKSPMAGGVDVFLPCRAGEEKSLAATKSVICSLLAIARIAAEWSQDEVLLNGIRELPDALERTVEVGLKADDQRFAGASHVFVLSRALGLSSALETALKIKETCGIHAEAFSAAEVRHGPREIVDGRYHVVAIALPGSGDSDVIRAATELKAQGAKVTVIGARSEGVDIQLPVTSDTRVMPIVALQFVYPWLARAAVALGRDPDHPKQLKSKVIKTI